MRHVRYDEWAALIQRILAGYLEEPSRSSILEIGAGTGTLGQRLDRLGLRYLASDKSIDMVRIARSRSLDCLAADGRGLPFKRAFDLVLFLYDGINYLWHLSDYAHLFEQVHRCLRPSGLFLFDITTPANSSKNFSDCLECEDFLDHYYIRHSYYDSAANMQYNDFTIFRRVDGNGSTTYQRFEEAHAQRVLPVPMIEEWIPRDKFHVEGIWEGFTFHRYSRHSERVHFLLRSRDSQ
jgi:SAM-dependent methyltransferase